MKGVQDFNDFQDITTVLSFEVANVYLHPRPMSMNTWKYWHEDKTVYKFMYIYCTIFDKVLDIFLNFS